MTGWSFDPTSFVLGIICGLLAALGFGWLRRLFKEGLVQRVRSWSPFKSRSDAGTSDHYRNNLINFTQSHHLGAMAAAIDAIFVPPRFIERPPLPNPDEEFAIPDSYSAYLWPELSSHLPTIHPPEYSLSQALALSDKIMLLAPPGGGKSTTLAFIANQCARREADFFPDHIPFFAHLYELGLSETTNGHKMKTIELPIIRAINNRGKGIRVKSMADLVRNTLKEGRALLLIDGWDELAQSERSVYTSYLKQMSDRYPGNRWVLSAPSFGYGPLFDFEPIQIKYWGKGEADQLSRRWRMVLGHSPSSAEQPNAEETAENDPINWKPGFTPLDSTLNIWISLAGKKPEPSHLDSLRISVISMLEPLQKGHTGWAPERILRALAILARSMDRNQTRSIDRRQLREALKKVHTGDRKKRRSKRENSKLLLSTPGPLVSWHRDRISFRTPALFYFFWSLEGLYDEFSPILRQRLADPTWEYAHRLLLEQDNSDQLVEQLLERPGGVLHDPLFLAANWASLIQVNTTWKKKVLARLAFLIFNSSSELLLRERAMRALIITRDPGVRYVLNRALTSPEDNLRAMAMPGLAMLASKKVANPNEMRAFQCLVEHIEDPSEIVQIAAIRALGLVDDLASIDILVHTLLHGSQAVSNTAAQVLAFCGEKGENALLDIIQNEGVLARKAALYGLGCINEPWIIDHLQTLLREDSDWMVRSAAEDMLVEQMEETKQSRLNSVRPENMAWLVTWAARRGKGVPTGEGALVMLHEALREGDSEAIKVSAALNLAAIGNESFLDWIKPSLDDPSPEVRKASYIAYAILSRAWNRSYSKI